MKSLGPSNDGITDEEQLDIGTEIDAAFYDVTQREDGGWGGRLAGFAVGYAGYLAHAARCDEIPVAGEGGWLAGEMATHDARGERDAEAWAWDISRPLAEQMAETASNEVATTSPDPASANGADPAPTCAATGGVVYGDDIRCELESDSTPGVDLGQVIADELSAVIDQTSLRARMATIDRQELVITATAALVARLARVGIR